jgi:hypothetical protein
VPFALSGNRSGNTDAGARTGVSELVCSHTRKPKTKAENKNLFGPRQTEQPRNEKQAARPRGGNENLRTEGTGDGNEPSRETAVCTSGTAQI